jgi:hypothetical protein
MTSTRKMLLGSAAATIAVTGGATTGAQAADAMLKKAPPIQYVRICDMYGARFFQIPGTTVCMAIRGSLQIDQAVEPTKAMLQVSQSGGKYTTAYFSGNNDIENWGYEVNAKPRLETRQETSLGTLRTYVELKTAYDAGSFASAALGGPGGSTQKAAQLYRGWFQWAGWTWGYANSDYCAGGYNTDDISDIISGAKCGGWTANYTWTPNGPGQPPVKGGAPFPAGWSVEGGVDWPLDFRSRALAGGTNLPSLILTGAAGAEFVSLHDATIGAPDAHLMIHNESDPPDSPMSHPGFNSQFGLATVQLGGWLHQIQAEAGSGGAGFINPSCPVGTPAADNCGASVGPTVRDIGYAVTAGLRFYTPMWGGANTGSLRQPDYIWLQADAANGASILAGVGGGNGNLSVGDVYQVGGFMRDDLDAHWVPNGTGGFSADKEKILTFNVSYHHIITDCTDPVHCWRMNLAYNWARATPGSATQNTDWTMGGLGVGTIQRVTFNLIWGADVAGTSKPTTGELQFEVQYNTLNQSLPNNCNGGLSACGIQTALPPGIALSPSNWVGRLTWSRGYP